jgi:hypothetical protein
VIVDASSVRWRLPSAGWSIGSTPGKSAEDSHRRLDCERELKA